MCPEKVLFQHHRIVILVTGRAAAEEDEGNVADVPDLVVGTGRNGDGVERADFAEFAVEFHATGAAEDVVNLLGLRMIMLLRGGSDGDGGLREALVADAGVAVGEELADFGAVFGGEGDGLGAIDDVHGRIFLDGINGIGVRN